MLGTGFGWVGWGLLFFLWIRGDEKYLVRIIYVPGIRDKRYFLKDLTNPPEKSLHVKNRSVGHVGEA